ncbi:MAG TPA: carboxylesterase family protein [Streptosporangiaceae bacterium]
MTEPTEPEEDAMRRRRSIRALSIIGSLAAVLPLVIVAPAEASGRSAPVVRVDTGALRGARADGVDSFLGVPYAAPPVGDLRWRPPRPAASWHGVRDAVSYGNRCAALASTNGPESDTEDCLYLNVQRPANARPGKRLPVYFWIHGGGLVNGSSNQHDAGLIVRNTGIVVVTINYRLGVFGYLAHPALTREAGQSGDYGFMDQQAALRWVHRNIGAFGGDPRQVTIGGESAGGWSVCAHLTAPGSRGLFNRAIMQSGSCLTQTLSAGEATGTTIATAAGCADPATAAACLRGKSTTDLLQAASGASSFAMVHGVPTLPTAPDTAVRNGDFAKVPVVIGANRDEGRTFAQGFIGQTQDQYVGFVRSAFGANADAVLAHYPWPAPGSQGADKFTPAYLVGAIFTDSGLVGQIGGCANRRLTQAFARSTRTYAYEFDHRTGPGLTPIPGYVWGAGHAAELAYLWPGFDNGTPIAPTFNAAERRLALDMVRYWGSFVRAGRPAAAFSSPWTRYDHTRQILSLRAGGRSTLISDARLAAEHQCDFWDAMSL